MNVEVSKLVELYKQFATVPFPASAILLPSESESVLKVYSTWKTEDVVKAEYTKFSKEYLVDLKTSPFNILSSGFPNDIGSIVLSAFSKSGKKRAIFRKKGKALEDGLYLEVWSSSTKESTFDFSERKEHGKINDDVVFSCLRWSSNEKHILYTAESKKPKTESFFKDFSSGTEQNKEDIIRGEENAYREEWGESLVGYHHSVLCVFHIESGKTEVFDFNERNIDISVASAVWGPNDEDIVFVGYKETPRRLGIIYCHNRRSNLYSVNLKSKELKNLCESESFVEFPRFTPMMDALFYLENKASGPHRMCSKLMKLDWTTKTLATIVDVVEFANEESFPGIYSENLPQRCFSQNGKFIFFTSVWRSYQVIIHVNTETSHVKKVEIDKSIGDSNVLDIQNDFILASVSSPNIKPCLVIGKINIDQNASVTWKYLDANFPSKLKDIDWMVQSLTPPVPNPSCPDLTYDILVLSPKEKKSNVPLVIVPHGGPHSAFTASFGVSSCFVKSGYILCMVNYRGSIGFGESSVKSLLGNVGTQDVQDVQHAAQYMKNHPNYNIGNVAVYGGSHGGFLAAHLCGQYPDFYKAAVCRNPVIDISANFEVTDIPDWCLVESGQGDVVHLQNVNPVLLKNMWEKSPIRYANEVSTPTLLLLGKKDLRVPSSQGLKYYHILKASGVPVKMYYYDDNHSLSKVDVKGDGFVQTVLWLQKYLLLERK